MEPVLLRQYEENGMIVQEYTKDGETVSHRVETPIPQPIVPQESQLDRIEDANTMILLKLEGII